MSRSQLEYVDLRDPSTRQSYVDDAPTPLEGTPLPDVGLDVSSTLPPPPPKRTKPPRHPITQPRSDKRPYVKTTLTQKLGLKAAFEKNGDALTDVQYSTQFGIPLKNTQRLLTELRKGNSILPKGHFSRKSRVLPYQHLVKRMIEVDPSITVQKMRECLVVLTNTLNQDAESTDASAVDPVLDQLMSGQPPPEVQPDEIELDQDNQAASAVPSESAIRRFLVGLSGTGEDRDVPIFSFKRETKRMPGANTDENKQQRVEAVQSLRMKLAQGYQWVCIDETSWCVGNTPAFGWSRRGDKCFITKSRNGIRLSSIAAIDGTGMSFCSISPGTHTRPSASTHTSSG